MPPIQCVKKLLSDKCNDIYHVKGFYWLFRHVMMQKINNIADPLIFNELLPIET